EAMRKVTVEICRPPTDSHAPDPCVFGGTYTLSPRAFDSLFRRLYRLDERQADTEAMKIVENNLSPNSLALLKNEAPRFSSLLRGPSTSPLSGKILLTSYVPETGGVSALEPTLRHEFGHACSMIRMQLQAGRSPNRAHPSALNEAWGQTSAPPAQGS